MSSKPFEIVVVGHGAAGLAAALSAAEEARARAIAAAVTLIEKAPEEKAGGNTRWSPSYMRMAAPDRVESSFVHDMLTATKFEGDETYFARLGARRARNRAVDRQPWHRVHPADLLPRQGPTAHPTGRRRPGDRRGARPRGESGGCRAALRLRGAIAREVRTAASPAS